MTTTANHYAPSLPLCVLHRAPPPAIPALVTVELREPADCEEYLKRDYRRAPFQRGWRRS